MLHRCNIDQNCFALMLHRCRLIFYRCKIDANFFCISAKWFCIDAVSMQSGFLSMLHRLKNTLDRCKTVLHRCSISAKGFCIDAASMQDGFLSCQNSSASMLHRCCIDAKNGLHQCSIDAKQVMKGRGVIDTFFASGSSMLRACSEQIVMQNSSARGDAKRSQKRGRWRICHSQIILHRKNLLMQKNFVVEQILLIQILHQYTAIQKILMQHWCRKYSLHHPALMHASLLCIDAERVHASMLHWCMHQCRAFFWGGVEQNFLLMVHDS